MNFISYTPEESSTLADLAYRRQALYCPRCGARVSARIEGVSGRRTSFVFLSCERCRAGGEYDPNHLEAMDLHWNRDEQVRLIEQYWQRRFVSCPQDGAVLQVEKSDEVGPGPTEIWIRCPHCGRHLSSHETESHVDPESFDGRYESLRKLAEGGMGSVELVRVRATGEELAAKRILPEFVRDAEMVRRFKREERLLRSLDHPNMVRLRDAFVDERGGVLVMDYMPGGTLHQAILDRTVTGETLAHLFAEVAAGTEFLHAKGVVHRDLKPENILLDGEGHARISDFGLAYLVDRDTTRLTRTGACLGTPIYAAPEQRGSAASVTKACDIWALGLIAYEIARRESPFEQPMSTDDLPERLRVALRTAMQREQEKRTISPAELSDALRG